jgi:uncharacterized membrane protein YkvA (DUF1232 family)
LNLSNLWSSWKRKAQTLRLDILALFYAYRDPRVPWYAKLLTGLLVAYAFSPVDLIPDFIPFLGYLDDLILLPLGIALVLRWIPDDVMQECRAKAADRLRAAQGAPHFPLMAVAVILVWAILLGLSGFFLYRRFRPR